MLPRPPTAAATPVVLADFNDEAVADRLALRLVAEGVAAAVWPAERAAALLPPGSPPLGPAVVVRRDDHGSALRLAQLFAAVDAGTCPVAPPPRDLWQGTPRHQLLAASLLLALSAAIACLLLAASLI